MFLDDTACNLASLNLMKYVNASGQFDVAASSMPGRDDHGAGNPGGQRELPDSENRGEFA